MKIVMPGGSGYLGRALTARLVHRGDEVVVLTRGPAVRHDGWRSVTWDGRTLGPWAAELDGADAVVHLNGKRVDVRSTRRAVDELIRSRVEPVRVVGEAVRASGSPPPVWVQASTLAIFGDGGEAVIDESTTPSGIGPREMVTVALAWESAVRLAAEPVGRTVTLRMGIGFGGAGDPATARLAMLVRLGLGGAVAGGRQWVSWVDLDDIIAAMLRAIDQPAMHGVYHVTSPNPVRNAELMAVFRRVLGRRIALPSPRLVARLGAPLLGSSATLALTGRRCVPTRLTDEGIALAHTDVEESVRRALDRLGDRPTADIGVTDPS